MKEEISDIWEKRRLGYFIVIPTNGSVNKDGIAVMGRGLAWDTKCRHPSLARELGYLLTTQGNQVYLHAKYGIITFPVKVDWWHMANISLIEESCKQLVKLVSNKLFPFPVYLPLVGCGYGRLEEKDVMPTLNKYLDDRFVLVRMKDD